MAILLLLVGLFVAGAGFLYLTQATLGVGLIGLGCLCAVLARIAQADQQHRNLLEVLDKRLSTISAPRLAVPPPAPPAGPAVTMPPAPAPAVSVPTPSPVAAPPSVARPAGVWIPATAAGSLAEAHLESVTCPKCGRENRPDRVVCWTCGETL